MSFSLNFTADYHVLLIDKVVFLICILHCAAKFVDQYLAHYVKINIILAACEKQNQFSIR